MLKRILSATIAILFFSSFTNAQLEVAYLKTKGFSGIGFGAFVNFAVPVTEYGFITVEAAFYNARDGADNIAIVPFLLGYRHMLQDPEAGFYIEPNAGYSIGATDIQKYNANGQLLYDTVTGEILERKAKGITAGVGAGYIFAGRIAFNIGLRYQRLIVSGDPSLNLFSLRISYPLSFRKREY
jgi:hypothetical protein